MTVKRLAGGVKDRDMAAVIRALEDKLVELERKVLDLERRVTALGG
jgi:hypothetical protein